MVSLNRARKSKSLIHRIVFPTILGIVIISLFFVAFGIWAVTAPISGAAIASGVIGPEDSRRIVQHLEGGIIKNIHVRDGDKVELGQILIELDDTMARASLKSQLVLKDSLDARRTRLETELKLFLEKKVSGNLTYSNELMKSAQENHSTRTLLAVEKLRFESRINALRSERRLLDKTIGGYEVEITGHENEIVSINTQLSLFEEERILFSELRKKGLELKSRVLQTKRLSAVAEQFKVESTSKISKLQESIKMSLLQKSELWVSRINEVSEELESVLQEILTIAQVIEVNRDVLKRTIINSPFDGILISLAVNTEGAVVAPGATLVEIVPSEESLVMEVRIRPNDIAVVQSGQVATISLLAYPQRNMPKIYGIVQSVSADSLIDTNTGDAYFLAKMQFKEGEIERLGDEIRIIPGMIIEAKIQTLPRTFLDYLISPWIKSLDRAFVEQ